MAVICFMRGLLLRTPTHLRRIALASLATAALTACGGGGDPAPASLGSTGVQRVITVGDSLADVGTFGLKFTVQRASSAAGYSVFPELVAQSRQLSATCNYFTSNGTSFAVNTRTGCTNYAIGGGRVFVPASQGGAANPQTVNTQLVAAAGAVSNKWNASDLILIDGGGNDAADLVGAYLGAASGAAGLSAFQAYLAQQLDAATIASLLPTADGPAKAAGAYMQKLGDTFATQILAQTTAKGATKVIVLNMPDITLTPRFQAVLAGVRAQGGAAAATGLQGAIRQWIGAFNTTLSTRLANNPAIGMVDFYGEFTDQVANPGKYALTNATEAVCPVTGRDSSGLPSYTFPTCTDAALDAAPPSGARAGWWTNRLFSDGFHPTPYGHQLLASAVVRAMDKAGF
jgi:outer membrane lipase/esterase